MEEATGYSALWEQVETPGRSSFHIRLFPLYIKPRQAHRTRFNKVQKPKPKPGWALKEVREEHCHDWHGHNMKFLPGACPGGRPHPPGARQPQTESRLHRALERHHRHTDHCPSSANRKSAPSTVHQRGATAHTPE